MKNFLVSIFVFTLLLNLSITAQTDEDKSTLTEVGQFAPSFRVTTLDDETLELSKLKGNVVLINFFATWCGPCNAELPLLDKEIYSKYNSKGLVVICIGREHSKNELIKFKSKKSFTLPMAPDPKREIYSLYAEKFIPRNILVGKDGKIIYQSVGFDQKQLVKMIEQNL